MIPKKNQMPDISNLTTALGCYLASTLAGGFQSHGYDKSKKTLITRFVTLVDKAKYEYLMAREAVNEEIKEGKMNYDEIIKRGEGQYMHVTTITNHFENCIITLGILFKLFEKLCDIDLEFFYQEIQSIVSNKKMSDSDKVKEIKDIYAKIDSIKMSKTKIVSKNITKIRNSVVHIEDRIVKGVDGGIILTINEEGTTISLLKHKLLVSDLAEVIKELNAYIRNLL